ncbi:MAG TPA: hypothetical protein VHK89_07595 [Actinomycetota bacterium]|jgi:heme/copper-type cytochrome/quinol oxidase subunit 4|nr:hypothetical protein [Actinomycetota bacterium]
MASDPWQATLVAALVVNAVSGFAYRVYRLARGGPTADAIGQAALGVVLVAIAFAVAAEAGWARWAALAYGVLFAIVVMPVWTVAVFIPMRPGPLDRAFAATYWAVLVVVVVAALSW